MYMIVGTIVQLTIASEVMALSLEGFLKSLPASMPEDLKTIIRNLHEKHPQEFGISETNANYGTETPVHARANDLNVKFMKSTNIKPVIQYSAPVTPVLRAGHPTPGSNNTNGSIQTKKEVTTSESPTSEVPNAGCQIPRIPLPQIPAPMMPIAIPVYPRMPIIVPARTYFEPVKHDHLPLYKIKEMIERDEKKWKKENKGENCDNISLELAYSDSSTSTDTESESRSGDVGSEYYDGFLKINI